jgi:hypothetical protein
MLIFIKWITLTNFNQSMHHIFCFVSSVLKYIATLYASYVSTKCHNCMKCWKLSIAILCAVTTCLCVSKEIDNGDAEVINENSKY